MKKYLSFIILLLFPVMVSAFEYRISDYIPLGTVFFENSTIDVYKSYGYTYNIDFIVDGKSVKNEMIDNVPVPSYGDTTIVYNNTKRLSLKKMDYEEDGDEVNMTAYFETVPSDVKIHCYIVDTMPPNQSYTDTNFDSRYCDDYLEEGNYYSTKDILYIRNAISYPHFYNGNKEEEHFYYASNAEYFPELEDENAYWVYVGSDDIGYQDYPSPIFEAYVPPKFEFKCEPKTIKQGETSKCTLYGISSLDLIRVNFDVDPKRYEIVNVTYPKGITKQSGDKQYNLRIASSVDQDHEGQVLGVFEITNNENLEFEDPIKIMNLDYVDEKAHGEYPNLEDPVEILAVNTASAEEKNPNTKAFSILVPLILFAITSGLYFIIAKTKKIKRYS